MCLFPWQRKHVGEYAHSVNTHYLITPHCYHLLTCKLITIFFSSLFPSLQRLYTRDFSHLEGSSYLDLNATCIQIQAACCMLHFSKVSLKFRKGTMGPT